MPDPGFNPNIIATLVPVNDIAVQWFANQHNTNRGIKAVRIGETGDGKTTPVNNPVSVDLVTCLQLTFNIPPKHPHEGFVFGRNSGCDIRLGDEESATLMNDR
jgi:hypothetical protein